LCFLSSQSADHQTSLEADQKRYSTLLPLLNFLLHFLDVSPVLDSVSQYPVSSSTFDWHAEHGAVFGGFWQYLSSQFPELLQAEELQQNGTKIAPSLESALSIRSLNHYSCWYDLVMSSW
jgi:hypothetical protein